MRKGIFNTYLLRRNVDSTFGVVEKSGRNLRQIPDRYLEQTQASRFQESPASPVATAK